MSTQITLVASTASAQPHLGSGPNESGQHLVIHGRSPTQSEVA
jgi:hypothetical protein